MKMMKNMLWMASGVGVGVTLAKYSKDIKKMMKKYKNDAIDSAEDLMNDMKDN